MIRVATIRMLQDLRKYRFSLKEKPFALFFKTMMFPLMKCRYCVLHYIIRML